jgi:membrane-associated phospholipid phosphatase
MEPSDTTDPSDPTDPTGITEPIEAAEPATASDSTHVSDPTGTADPSDSSNRNREALHQLKEADTALFRAVAGWNTPFLDRTMPALSNVASNSVLWIGTGALLAAVGGRRGRLVAAEALVAVGITSAVTNLAAKNLVRRPRPDSEVPESRRLEHPDSSSFPSGHSASAAAFSAVVGTEYRHLYLPINALAAAVGFSRVYTGVHYPGDVAAGWAIGRAIGGTVRTAWPNKWR